MASPQNPFPVMQHMTVKLVREYLTRKQSILLPIGVIEQHGYHLPLNTDVLTATHVAQRVGERTEVLVAPPMYQSFSGGSLPGTINISPAVMSLVLTDMLLSLNAQGFRHFYLVLGHGGSENARALNDAVKMLLRNNPAFDRSMIALLPIWEFGSPGQGWNQAVREHDWHAGWLETSLVMAIAPDLVRMDELALDPEPLLSQQIEHPDNYQHAEKIVDNRFVIPRQTQRPEIQVGVMGRPEKARADLGRQILDDIVANMAREIETLDARADGTYKEVAFTPEPLIFSTE